MERRLLQSRKVRSEAEGPELHNSKILVLFLLPQRGTACPQPQEFTTREVKLKDMKEFLSRLKKRGITKGQPKGVCGAKEELLLWKMRKGCVHFSP